MYVLRFANVDSACSLHCTRGRFIHGVHEYTASPALMHARDVHINTCIHTYVNTHLHISYLKDACTLLQKYSVFALCFSFFRRFLRARIILHVAGAAPFVGRCEKTNAVVLRTNGERLLYHRQSLLAIRGYCRTMEEHVSQRGNVNSFPRHVVVRRRVSL